MQILQSEGCAGGKVMVHAILDQKTDAVTRLLRQQAALATFGSYAFHETDLLAILTEAARICAESLEVPYCKVAFLVAGVHKTVAIELIEITYPSMPA